MAYTKQGFKDGDPLFAKQLENMEDGIIFNDQNIEDLLHDVNVLYKKQNYTLTGSYTNLGGQYQVALDDNYSWNSLVAAVQGGRSVCCVLLDEDKLLPLIFTAGEVFVEDGMVNLHSDGENAVRRELYIYENGDLELFEFSLATRAEMDGKLDAYTFTGEYTYNSDNTYTVTLDDNYSWNKLLTAVKANKDIRCVLTDGEYKTLLTFASDYLIDGYVVLTSVEEGAFVWQLDIHQDGQYLSAYMIAHYSELRNKLDAYVFSGKYTKTDVGGYDVVLDSSYNWNTLRTAVSNEKYVVCVLTFDTGNKIYMTLTESALGNDDYVVFTSLVNGSGKYSLRVHSDGTASFFWVALATIEYVDNTIANSTDNIVAAVLEALPTWEGGSY